MDIRKNPWLKDANRRSMIQVRITSLNLHGTGRRSGIVKRSEVFTTMFKMEVRLGRRAAAQGGDGPGHMWTQARTFDEFREFYDRLVATGGANAKEKLSVPFPVGKDGEADVFILLERKDEMEALIQDVVANLDMLLYRPLFAFLGAEAGLVPYLDSLVCAQALVRAYIRRKSVLKELCHKYEDEQRELFHVLSGPNGIPVVSIPPTPYVPISGDSTGDNSTTTNNKPSFRRRVLWLEVNKTAYSLSLLCLASEKRFRAAKARKDWIGLDFDRSKYTAIPLCDIAEVRRGPCSRAFRAFPRQDLVDPMLCLVVVGSAGTMNIQLVTKSGVERDWLLDSLAMMGNNSLSHAEARLRGRKWRRYHNVKTLLPVPSNKTKLSAGRMREAKKMKKLLLDVIDVEEEVCEYRGPIASEMAVPISISERVLWFDESERRVHLSEDPNLRQLPAAQRAADRGLDIDDIAEVRPGRTAFDVDGSDIEPILCIIGSETVIRLPMDTVKKRNKLIGYFQSFIGLYKNHEFACSDQWAPLWREDGETVIEEAWPSVSSELLNASVKEAHNQIGHDPLLESTLRPDSPAQPTNVTAARSRTHSTESVRRASGSEAKRRGSHTLAECVDEIQSEIAEDEANKLEVALVLQPQELQGPRVELLRDRGESWSGIITDAAVEPPSGQSTAEMPSRMARAESMSEAPDKAHRSIFQRAGHKVAKRLSFVTSRVSTKRGSAPASTLRPSLLSETIPEVGADAPSASDDQDEDVLRIGPKGRRNSLTSRFMK